MARERATVRINKRKTELNSGCFRVCFAVFRRVAQFGSAPPSGGGGRRFKSCYADRGAETTRGRSAAAVAVTQGCVAALDGALGVCGWRLGVCARMLSVLVSKLGRSGLAG